MYTTDYTPGALILSAGETFRYLGEFYAPFVTKKVQMYDPIKTDCKYTPFVGEPEWHSRNNIPESAVPFNSKIYGEPILEEDIICK
jgi:hypothetical protein